MGGSTDSVLVRMSGPADVPYAAPASAMIAEAARSFDIAERSVEFLTEKLESGKAALALVGDELVGFGYYSAWQGGKFVSHSGLVVRPDLRGTGLGRRLKEELFRGSLERYPEASTMSLTTSPQVKAMNLRLGFEVVPLDRLTTDESFWDGCKTCRNYAEVQAKGERCCCEGMLRPPG